jgi:hypothetical protein
MLWKAPVRGRGISSPIVVGDRVFVTAAHRLEGGLRRLKTIAIATLSGLALRLWQTRRTLSEGCTPVVGNGLYVTLVDGLLRCIDPAGAVHWTERLGTGDYWSALVEGRVLVRTEEYLYCFGAAKSEASYLDRNR